MSLNSLLCWDHCIPWILLFTTDPPRLFPLLRPSPPLPSISSSSSTLSVWSYTFQSPSSTPLSRSPSPPQCHTLSLTIPASLPQQARRSPPSPIHSSHNAANTHQVRSVPSTPGTTAMFSIPSHFLPTPSQARPLLPPARRPYSNSLRPLS